MKSELSVLMDIRSTEKVSPRNETEQKLLFR